MIIAKLPWWAKRLMARFGNLSLEQLNPLAPLQTLPQSAPPQTSQKKENVICACRRIEAFPGVGTENAYCTNKSV